MNVVNYGEDSHLTPGIPSGNEGKTEKKWFFRLDDTGPAGVAGDLSGSRNNKKCEPAAVTACCRECTSPSRGQGSTQWKKHCIKTRGKDNGRKNGNATGR
jgi:hypothetical protein